MYLSSLALFQLNFLILTSSVFDYYRCSIHQIQQSRYYWCSVHQIHQARYYRCLVYQTQKVQKNYQKNLWMQNQQNHSKAQTHLHQNLINEEQSNQKCFQQNSHSIQHQGSTAATYTELCCSIKISVIKICMLMFHTTNCRDGLSC